MRRTLLPLLVAATTSGGPTTTSTKDDVVRRTNNIFDLRKSPTSLYETSMHSNTLTDHPLTHRTNRDELAYRKRKLTERGQLVAAAEAEAEAATRDREGRAGAETREYFWAIAFAVLGYLAAHTVVFNYYYPDDLRLSYAPDRGYTDEVAMRREQLAAVDELVGLSVLESIYSKRKAMIKKQVNG